LIIAVSQNSFLSVPSFGAGKEEESLISLDKT